MTLVTHQTIRLGKGKHGSAEDGACVMELASMLAGEPFSDHPESVCPVIGSLLRAYNDSLEDERRQDLYAYASMVVGSRGSAELERARTERLEAWIADLHVRRRPRFSWIVKLRALTATPPIAPGARAVHALGRHTDATHAAALALIDELLEMGTGRSAKAPTIRQHGAGPGSKVSRTGSQAGASDPFARMRLP